MQKGQAQRHSAKPAYPIASVDNALCYLDAVESSRALRVAARTGAALPANCTASGKAMLAALPEPEVTALFGEAALPALTKRSVTRLPDLLAELNRVRKRGYALNREESQDGVASVAVAVAGRTTRPLPRWSSRRP